MDEKRTLGLLVLAVYVAGLAGFIGVRWADVVSGNGADWPEILWFAVPFAATYTGAASLGLILVRDGVTRWWWLPAVLLVTIGFPVEAWLTGSAPFAWKVAPIAGAIVDALFVLAPAAVLLVRSHSPRVDVRGRTVPVVAVAAVSSVLAMLVGQTGPDVSLSVGITMLAFGACSQASTWKRALGFIAIAMALGAEIPASFANAASQGSLGPVAIRDGSLEVVIACLCFAIAPLSTAWGLTLDRRADRQAAA